MAQDNRQLSGDVSAFGGVAIRSRLDALIWTCVDCAFTAREQGRDETPAAVAELLLDYVRLLAAFYRGAEYTEAILRESLVDGGRAA